MNIMELVES